MTTKPKVDTPYIQCRICGEMYRTADAAFRHYRQNLHAQMDTWEVVIFSEEDLRGEDTEGTEQVHAAEDPEAETGT